MAETGAWHAQLPALDATLSPDEQGRVRRMRFERDRIALTVAYGLHRAVLANVLGQPPGAVPLYRDALGRPRIDADVAWTSLSHAAGWIAVAVDAHAPVGIDVEPMSRAPALEEVVDCVVHPDERDRVAGGCGQVRARALLALWVAKEAALKAAGVGLRVPMNAFPVAADGTVRIPGIDGQWRVQRIAADAAIEVALAAAGRPAVRCSVIEPSHGRDAGIAYASRS